ncbi:MAG: alpha/beta fold hydrolase [Planctomycetales bacterium]|nr:alpha/beta fold hydrolase [Planctomycetales bacterium]
MPTSPVLRNNADRNEANSGHSPAVSLNRGYSLGISVLLLLSATWALAEEDIAFVAEADGTQQRYVQQLPARFDAERPVDVLIALHGHGSDRWQFIRQSRAECRAVRDVASRAGMILISPDYRASTSWMGPLAEADTLQIITKLKRTYQVRHVVLCGASMGGSACLTFAALHPDLVDGVVSMNGTANHVEYQNFQDAIAASFGGSKADRPDEYRRRSAELWSHRLTMPTAFTVGGKDASVPPHSVLRLATTLQRAKSSTRCSTKLLHRPEGGHSTTYEDAVAALDFVIGELASPKPPSVDDSGDDSGDATDKPRLHLLLPREVCSVVGQETNLYFDNLVLTETPEAFRFEIKCRVGKTEQRRWTLVPAPEMVGRHPLQVTVSTPQGELIAQADTTLNIAAAAQSETPFNQDRPLRLLIVGDSLTNATTYPNELARLLSQPGNPPWKMLGTHRPSRAAAGVRHEGYGGWTWHRFLSLYKSNPDGSRADFYADERGVQRRASSPFVYADSEGKPQLNVSRYLDETASGERPDVVFFLLGINDCFSADPDDPAATDARIDSMLEHAETLLGAFRAAAPLAELVVCITTPPNAREAGFEANYQGRYHRWGWKRIQHRLVERLSKHFATGSAPPSDHTWLAPVHLGLDPVDGYPINNGVHPNEVGYRQIGGSLYAWLKCHLAER